MATATRKNRATRRVAGRGSVASASMEFLIVEDNGGGYHWAVIGSGGQRLARSEGFESYDEAEHAALAMREGAGSARLERRLTGDRPVDLVARRDAALARDDLDAERWLDEGGSFSSKAVAQWPARR